MSATEITASETTDGIDWAELSALYRRAPLGDKSAGFLATAFGNSRYRVFLRDGARLVGAGRAVADGVDCAYLCDIAVLPEYHRAGLGRRILDTLVQRASGHRKIILYAVAGREALYRKAGFARMTTAFAIFADQAAALRNGLIDTTAAQPRR